MPDAHDRETHRRLAALRRRLAPSALAALSLTAPLELGCLVRCYETQVVRGGPSIAIPLDLSETGLDPATLDAERCLVLCVDQLGPDVDHCSVEAGQWLCHRVEHVPAGGCMPAGRPPGSGYVASVRRHVRPAGRRDGHGLDTVATEDEACAAAAAELASVAAFERLGAWLGWHGLPTRLAAAMRRCAAQERAHAAMRLSTTRARGISTWVPHERIPSLCELAVDNARVGCVGEVFGAFEAARSATDLRTHDTVGWAVEARIAYDEAGHALVSLALDAALRARLGPRARTEVDAARREARHDLARSVRDHATGRAAFVDAFGDDPRMHA